MYFKLETFSLKNHRNIINGSGNNLLSFKFMIYFFYVPVAQLDRALASGAKGREFESRLEHHMQEWRNGRRATLRG